MLKLISSCLKWFVRSVRHRNSRATVCCESLARRQLSGSPCACFSCPGTTILVRSPFPSLSLPFSLPAPSPSSLCYPDLSDAIPGLFTRCQSLSHSLPRSRVQVIKLGDWDCELTEEIPLSKFESGSILMDSTATVATNPAAVATHFKKPSVSLHAAHAAGSSGCKPARGMLGKGVNAAVAGGVRRTKDPPAVVEAVEDELILNSGASNEWPGESAAPYHTEELTRSKDCFPQMRCGGAAWKCDVFVSCHGLLPQWRLLSLSHSSPLCPFVPCSASGEIAGLDAPASSTRGAAVHVRLSAGAPARPQQQAASWMHPSTLDGSWQDSPGSRYVIAASMQICGS